MHIDYTNKTVMVVGGTSGINRGIAETFARLGARVAVASRSPAKVDDTVTSLKELGVEAMGFTADVRKVEDIEAGFAKVHNAFGNFDTLVSGAAGNFPAFANDMSSNGFKSVVDIDLLGTFNVLRSAFPFLVKPGGSIINVSAPQAFLPTQAQSHVCAAKAGVDMITRCLALEWGEDGVRVNSIVPGPIEGTEGMKRLAPAPEHMEFARLSVPLKRLGRPEDIGMTCAFILFALCRLCNWVCYPCGRRLVIRRRVELRKWAC